MADQRIQYSEEIVGANHSTKSDTLNRLALIEHNTDGTHKITQGQNTLGSTVALNLAAGSYQDLGLSLALPNAGVYYIFANIRTQIAFSSGSNLYVVARLYNSTDATWFSTSERLCNYTDVVATTRDSTHPLIHQVTLTAAKTIKLYAQRNGTYTTVSQSNIMSDSSGYTNISCIKVA